MMDDIFSIFLMLLIIFLIYELFNFSPKQNDDLTLELDKARALLASLKKRLSIYEAV